MKKKQIKIGLEMKASKGSAEVLIYDDIGDGWMGGISAKTFADELNALGDLHTINLRVNSSGGSVFDGVAIYNTLVKNSAKVIVDIDGIAASIASIIAMSGDTIRMANNAFMMIHDPWTVAAGSADELRKQADTMDKVRDSLLTTYVDRTGLDSTLVAEMMADETWFDASDALAKGFVDEVTGEQRMAARVDVSKFKNAPTKLAEELEKSKQPNLDKRRVTIARLNKASHKENSGR